MSFYSGPNPFIPEGKKIQPHWQGLGWNPIQSGDCFGHRSRVIAHTNDGKTLYVQCIPMIWPLENTPGECTFECTYRLEGRTVHISSRLNNARPDQTWYGSRDQELPAVYTNGPYHTLMTYTGDKPYTGDALVEIPKKKPGESGIWADPWNATENWAALVNDSHYGLGVWHPGVYRFIGGFACGQPGQGGPKDAPTGYISPILQEILDWNIVYEYSYVLIADTLDNIRKYVYDHASKDTLPHYQFHNNRQHWVYGHARDTGWPIQGYLEIRAKGNDVQLVGPDTFWQSERQHKLFISAAAKKNDAPNIYPAQIFWKTATCNHFTEENSIPFTITADETFMTYCLDIGGHPNYQGAITGLRLDPFDTATPDEWVRIRSIEVK